MNYFSLSADTLTIDIIDNIIDRNKQIALSDELREKVEQCRNFLDEKTLDPDKVFYGVNTGFGFLQHIRVNASDLEQLQYNLLKSHACGTGEKVPMEVVKRMILLKIKSLSYGYSGVQTETVDALINMYNRNILPVVYTQGSLGASGDLAPLSHLCLPIIGLGNVDYQGREMPAAEAFQLAGINNVSLKSKEGLALINGTQFMSGYGVFILSKAQHLLRMADMIAALSFDAFDCVTDCLHPSIHKIRPHKHQMKTAATVRNLLAGSEIAKQKKQQVQDPYSFRCIPQVHGASKEVIEQAARVFTTEINSVTDNPNVVMEDDLILSGGNFHGQILSMHLDFLAIALSEIGSISERRTYQLISGQRNLPLFLIKDSGLHSGFMIPQYTAAGIVSENKQLSTPASIDSIPSSNNQEDHVSMGANAATKCLRVLNNLQTILGIELLTAAQALDFKRPLQTSSPLESLFASFREEVSFNTADRILHDDIIKAANFVGKYVVIEGR